MERKAEIRRNTSETDIMVKLNLDGTGTGTINTGIGFFDHMLNQIARHGFFDLEINAQGDTFIDAHHTVEDAGIVLGQAIAKALNDKAGICRYGSAVIPMDETLVLVALDLSGRAYFHYEAEFTAPVLGNMDTELFEEFFRSLANNCGMNLHIKVIHGSNNHHMAEGMFKAFAKALDMACTIDTRIKGTLSTKGSL